MGAGVVTGKAQFERAAAIIYDRELSDREDAFVGMLAQFALDAVTRPAGDMAGLLESLARVCRG